MTGFLHPQQSPVGIADDEAAVARVGLQAQGAAMGVGEQPGRAEAGEPGRPAPDPAVLNARVQPAGGVEDDVFGFGPAGYLPPLDLVEHPVGCQHALEGRTNLIAGANKENHHLRNVTPGRDFTPTLIADIRNINEGEPDPIAGQPLRTPETSTKLPASPGMSTVRK